VNDVAIDGPHPRSLGRPVGLLRDPLERRIVSLAVPALGTLAVEPIYLLVDTAIVGRVGTPQLAGVAIASIVLLNVVSLLSFLEYITPTIAFDRGAGMVDSARRRAGDGLSLTVTIGLPAAVLLAIGARPLCWLLGGRGDVLDHATTYLTISAAGLPFVLLAFLGHGVLRGYNDLRTPLKIAAVANVVNLVVELVFVFGLDLGVAGSAWSTVIAQAGAGLAFVAAIRPHLRLGRLTWSAVRPLVVSGVHIGLRSVAMYTVWNATTVIAAHLDAPTLAANQIANQLFFFMALLLDALAVPLHSLVAEELGAGRGDEAGRVGRVSTRLSVWCGAGLAVLIAAAAPVLPGAFTADEAVHTRLVGALLVLAVMQIPGAIAFALDGALIGANDMPWLGRQAVRNIIAFVPLAVATVIWPRLGLAGLWGAQLCWMTTRALVNGLRWRKLSSGWVTRVAQVE
jgi:putative MATE family efflux protein